MRPAGGAAALCAHTLPSALVTPPHLPLLGGCEVLSGCYGDGMRGQQVSAESVNQEELVWLGGGHPQPLSWALLLQRQEGPPEPHQAQRSPQSLGRLALHCCGVHSQDGRTPGWDGGRILEELFPLACRPASSGLHPEDPGRAALAPSLGFPMCRIVPRGQPGPRGRCRRCGPLRPEAPAGQASPQEAGPYILRAHAGHTRPCTRTSTAQAVCISPHSSVSC